LVSKPKSRFAAGFAQPCAFGVAAFRGERREKIISKLIIAKAYGAIAMSRGSVDMNFLFTLAELQRVVRAYADKEAARYGITRAQWAVLAKVERSEGLKQSELAEQMEMQPITLTRLIDRLCDNGWIERRSDDADRRVNRLYLRKAARPLLGKLSGLRSELTATAMEGINPSDAHRLLAQLELIKENVRNAIQGTGADITRKEQRYG
jgi:DNA-binding MarR family transcriptional regulator